MLLMVVIVRQECKVYFVSYIDCYIESYYVYNVLSTLPALHMATSSTL